MNFKSFINKRNMKKYESLAQQILGLEKSIFLDVSPEKIAEKLFEIKEDKQLNNRQKTLYAMALARKASSHVLNMPYYKVQLMGALALVDGCIAEMKTGEGKTLTCSAAVAANYVLGYTTHVATANEYLAQRDQQQLERLYSFMGISSSYNTSQMVKQQKKQAYSCNVVYSTAQEFGFDFLRDNLVYHLNEKIQPLNFNLTKAIIDEADFILIDEARTPLIISGESPLKELETYSLMMQFAHSMRKMKSPPEEGINASYVQPEGDFWLDEKTKNVHLSDMGYYNLEKMAINCGLLEIPNHEQMPSLYQNNNSWIIHELLNALKAKYLYIRDKDYVVQNGEIVIIDQNTGRLSQGRNWSNGLHQAIEAKEGLTINPETMTLGSISVQNYFKTYCQISGMSGTVMQSSEEFEQIYNCKTIQIRTNKPMIRVDHQDQVYLSMSAKYNALIKEIEKRNKRGQPILVGTTSVSESEIVSKMLSDRKISHHVLNAKNNAKEAQIIAQAGQPYSVTVSTSMAGRGTDIILGGNKESLLDILHYQRDQINERKAFFKDLAQQLNIVEPSLEEQLAFEKQNEVFIESNDIQQQIDYLYNPQHIAAMLGEGILFINKHLNILYKSILKEISIVESSWENWRQHVVKVGGLCVIGSSRNESRRIDDQLRGRAGRQGDPGESIFYMSIEDPWVNIFGKNPLFSHLTKTLPAHDVISSPMVSRAFAKAQSNIESHHFDARKNTFQYDSVADEGRKKFLYLRNSLLIDTSTIQNVLRQKLMDTLMPLAHEDFTFHLEEKLKINIENHIEIIKTVLTFPLNEIKDHVNIFLEENLHINNKQINSRHLQLLEDKIDDILENQSLDLWRELNSICLFNLDKLWTNHLIFIDDAQKNVAFSAIAQKNPLYEYKKLCFESFSYMLEDFKNNLLDEFISLIYAKQGILHEYELTENENLALS